MNVHIRSFEKLKTDKSRRYRLIRDLGHQCQVCLNTEWQQLPIPLELDHLDGDPENNRKENLRLICPNCHAQTATYKGKNKGKVQNTKRQNILKRYQGKYR